MDRLKRKLSAAFVFAVVTMACLTLSQRADAIPVFARKYHTSCMTCHEMFPRLNAFGEAFRLNGFVWPGGPDVDAQQRKQEPIPLGQEAYKDAFPDAVWPTELPETVPLAIRGLGTYTQHPGDPDWSRTFESEWELQTGGNLGDSLSWFGHANFVTVALNAPQIQTKIHVVGHVNIEGILGRRLLNLQLGTVGFEEADYYHYRNHSTNQLLAADQRPFVASDTVPYPAGFYKADLFRLFRGPGAMLWGTTARTDYSLGYRMGQEMNGGSDMHVGFFHYAVKIAGMDHYGRTSQQYSQGYMEDSLSLGVFGDVGMVDVQPTPTSPFSQDKFWRGGGDVQLKVQAWSLRGGAYRGGHVNPYGVLDSNPVYYTNWFAQTDYHFLPWLLPELRFEKSIWDAPSTLPLGQTDRARVVASINALYGANLRFTLWSEIYTQRRTSANGAQIDGSTIGALVDWGI